MAAPGGAGEQRRVDPQPVEAALPEVVHAGGERQLLVGPSDGTIRAEVQRERGARPSGGECSRRVGWFSVVAMPQIVQRTGAGALALLAAGGAAYTAGAVIYARRRPDPRPATFGYHVCNPADVLSAEGKIIDSVNEPGVVMDNPLVDLVDLNGDGLVDFSDYLVFLNLFDGGC